MSKYKDNDIIEFLHVGKCGVTVSFLGEKIDIEGSSTATVLAQSKDEYAILLPKGNTVVMPKILVEELSEPSSIKAKDKQYSSVVESNLTFGEALSAIKKGKMVTRGIWDGYWYMESITFDGNEGRNKGFRVIQNKYVIMAKLKSGEYAVASPYQSDLLAEDWMIVK